MNEIIKYFIEILKVYSKNIGLPEWVVNEFTLILLFMGLAAILLKNIYSFVKWISLWNNQRFLNRDLHPYYTYNDVERTTKYYIPLKYQNVAPSEDDEPGRKYIASAKDKIIPLFVNKVFQNKLDGNKYFLILADSGMGKTTFMINLYINYKNKIKTPFANQKYSIKLLPLGNIDVEHEIDNINDKENTILLLDAFDEDLEAVKDYRKRLNEILLKVHKFRVIIITCRTQFFPSREEEPYETGYFSGGEHGEYKFQKLYLSVFDDDDIISYLRKRYSRLFNFIKYKRAKEICKKSPNLVVRPMLLSYIDELIQSNTEYEFSFQIYEELIEKWMERESKKPKMRERFNSREKFVDALRKFSEKLAVDLYKNREEYGGYFLPKNIKFTEGLLDLSDIEENELTFSDRISKTKSLLNRDAVGNYKFAHKSILEYFLAKEFFINHSFFRDFNFLGMDAAKIFSKEMLVCKLRKTKGEYSLRNDGKSIQSLENIILKNIPEIKYLRIDDLSEINPRMLSTFTNLSILILYDDKIFDELYFVYCFVLFLYSLKDGYGSNRRFLYKKYSLLASRFSRMYEKENYIQSYLNMTKDYDLKANEIFAEIIDSVMEIFIEKEKIQQRSYSELISRMCELKQKPEDLIFIISQLKPSYHTAFFQNKVFDNASEISYIIKENLITYQKDKIKELFNELKINFFYSPSLNDLLTDIRYLNNVLEKCIICY